MAQLVIQLVAVEVVVMLLLRPVIWWYFGIGRAIRALEISADCLRLMNGRAVKASITRRAS